MTPRLKLLLPILEQYQRPFSVLDIGSGIEADQSIGMQITDYFPHSCCISIEKDWSADRFKYSLPKRNVVLKRHFSADDILRLGECEHFDVVLAFNVMHWFPTVQDSAKALGAITFLGDNVFLQIPTKDEDTPMGKDITSSITWWLEGTDPIGETVQFPGHKPRPLYHLRHKRTLLTRTHWDAHDDSAATDFGYDASYDKPVRATLKSGKIVPWIPGMNLRNFLKLGGVVPTREALREMLRTFQLPELNHGDITAHNLILDGERLHLIDGYEDWGGDDKENLQKIMEAL